MYQKKIGLDGGYFPVRFLQKNIDDTEKIYNLPNNHKITKALISQIIATAKHHVPHGQGNGFTSPLLKIEYEVCNLIIEMSKCHHPITVFNTLNFINNLITKTEYQVRLN